MRIADRMEMLDLQASLMNGPGIMHPVFAWDEKDVVLFDAGLPGMGETIAQAAKNALVPFERLNKILITHSDMDHIGSLSQIVQARKGAITVYAHKEEKPYIECKNPPLRLQQMEQSIESSTGAKREQMIALTEGLKKNYKLFRSNVDQTVQDGEVLPFCGGITCIATPGHTPGHMCYYFAKQKLLIAGDILQVDNQALVRCPDFTIWNREALAASLAKLSRYEIETVVCYHGGLFHGDAIRRIEEIAASSHIFGGFSL